MDGADRLGLVGRSIGVGQARATKPDRGGGQAAPPEDPLLHGCLQQLEGALPGQCGSSQDRWRSGHDGGGGRRDRRPGRQALRDRAVGARPGRRAPAPPADAVRAGRERRRLPPRRLGAVHLDPARPGRRPPRRRRRRGGLAVAAARRRRGGPDRRRGSGGIATVRTARRTGTVAFLANLFPGVESLEEDREHGKARENAGVGALLFESYPVRYWDHYLGPREPRLFATPPPADEGRIDPAPPLTPTPGRALDETSFELTPDGATIVTTWEIDDDVRNPRAQLVAIDVGTGERRVLVDDPESTLGQVACSPDGRLVACQRIWPGTPDEPPRFTLWLVDLAGGEGRDLLPGLELQPDHPVWTPDGEGVLFVADQQGRTPVFRVEIDDGTVTRLSAEGSFSELCPAPDGRRLYALRASVSSPPQAVALATSGADQRPEPLPTPGLPLEVPGTVTEVHTTAADGVPLRAWLVLPADAAPSNPAPLVTFVHGGPVSSWSGWTWRWNA